MFVLCHFGGFVTETHITYDRNSFISTEKERGGAMIPVLVVLVFPVLFWNCIHVCHVLLFSSSLSVVFPPSCVFLFLSLTCPFTASLHLYLIPLLVYLYIVCGLPNVFVSFFCVLVWCHPVFPTHMISSVSMVCLMISLIYTLLKPFLLLPCCFWLSLSLPGLLVFVCHSALVK